MRYATVAATVLCLFATAATADELIVPSVEYPTIQAAVDAAVDGDEVVLRDGVFTGPGNLDIDMPSKRLTIRALNPRGATIAGSGLPFPDQTRAFVFSGSGSSGTVIRDIIIQGCNGEPQGGAVRTSDCSLEFINCDFVGNFTSDDRGGGSPSGGAIWMSNSSVRFVGCDFRSNFVYPVVFFGTGDGFGGAIHASGGIAEFESCNFIQNRALGSDMSGSAAGGAISSSGTTLVFRQCKFQSNSTDANGATGGAIRARPGNVVCIDTDFISNSATGSGFASSGAASVSGTLVMINGEIVRNRADDRRSEFASAGGLRASGTIVIANTLVVDNRESGGACDLSGTGGYGGGLVLSGDVRIYNSIITENRADCADGIYVPSGSSLFMANTILRNGLDGLQVDPDSTSDVRYSNIQGGFPGEGNIDADPLFEAGTYRLLPGSPCIDAGNTDLLPADEFDLDGDGDTAEPIPFDADGLSRFVDDPATPDTGMGFPVVDMGAFEFQPPCRVDLDGDGSLTIFDFLAFFNAFDDADPVADFDGDGAFTVFDFLAFQNEFDIGCP